MVKIPNKSMPSPLVVKAVLMKPNIVDIIDPLRRNLELSISILNNFSSFQLIIFFMVLIKYSRILYINNSSGEFLILVAFYWKKIGDHHHDSHLKLEMPSNSQVIKILQFFFFLGLFLFIYLIQISRTIKQVCVLSIFPIFFITDPKQSLPNLLNIDNSFFLWMIFIIITILITFNCNLVQNNT